MFAVEDNNMDWLYTRKYIGKKIANGNLVRPVIIYYRLFGRKQIYTYIHITTIALLYFLNLDPIKSSSEILIITGPLTCRIMFCFFLFFFKLWILNSYEIFDLSGMDRGRRHNFTFSTNAPVIKPSLVQIMACRLVGAKPLFEPILE